MLYYCEQIHDMIHIDSASLLSHTYKIGSLKRNTGQPCSHLEKGSHVSTLPRTQLRSSRTNTLSAAQGKTRGNSLLHRINVVQLLGFSNGSPSSCPIQSSSLGTSEWGAGTTTVIRRSNKHTNNVTFWRSIRRKSLLNIEKRKIFVYKVSVHILPKYLSVHTHC